MNPIIVLERKGSELTGDIQDILHAASLNFKAINTEVNHQSFNTFQDEFIYLQKMLEDIQKIVGERSSYFMSYLIIKQIQEEEGRVRRERLTEYQEKIYDQKRIITDKETFFQNLQRPKRKRPSYQTPEEFQEVRAREREQQQKAKNQQLVREISELHALKKMIAEQQKNMKKIELQKTKSSSISQVNVTVGEVQEIISERRIPFDDRSNKENKPTHVRATSVQCEFEKESNSHFKKEDNIEDYNRIMTMLATIQTYQHKNQDLHCIYDQSLNSLKFKQSQYQKIQQTYKQKNKQLIKLRPNVMQVKNEESWKLNRVSSPIRLRKLSR